MKLQRGLLLIIILCLTLAPTSVLFAQEEHLSQALTALAAYARSGMTAATNGNAAEMQTAYVEGHEHWETFEDAVREHDPAAYVELEAALDEVKEALAATPIDATQVEAAYDHLLDEATEIAERFATGAPVTTLANAAIEPANLLETLTKVEEALRSGNMAGASAELQEAVAMWPAIEGAVAAKSPEAYGAIESALGRATSGLRATPVDVQAVAAAVDKVKRALGSFTTAQTYTAFDAAAIILREGLEALLVIVALLAFLRRSNNGDKGKWIWMGAGAGVVASIGAAFLLQSLFSRVSAGQNRELIEGITGLLAAALLFYVSYWLHSKTSLHGWQRYINNRTTQALARGSVFSLMVLSFLAVFREGAETAIFYLGMAPAIRASELALGLGIGVGLLVIAAIIMLVAGVRLPLRLFFRVAGLLVYYLGFKFVGAGLHALQVAGILPISSISRLTEIPVLGIYPTWETLIPQVLLLAVAGAVILYLRKIDQQQPKTAAALS